MNPLLPEEAQRNLILASRSPRRRDILRRLDFEFEIIPAREHVEDEASCDDPFERPEVRARLKAADVSSRHPDAIVIGADTVVIIDGDVLEKPSDDGESIRFLRRLSGREHTVVTGVAVRRDSNGLDLGAREETKVRFRKLTDTEVLRYVASGEGRGKAGSYAVQGLGAGLVRSINGCFYNVVGLPVSLLFDLLRKV
ncbi:MAG: septum formation protein Maf [Candidatus Latescibacterota bacterium]|nr:MAG: septum formation protein Maf [Candidatus Latescibacterota bacterium]